MLFNLFQFTKQRGFRMKKGPPAQFQRRYEYVYDEADRREICQKGLQVQNVHNDFQGQKGAFKAV